MHHHNFLYLYLQVRQRAVDFFQELCQKLKLLAEQEGSNEVAASIKCRRHTGSGSLCSTGSDVFPPSDSPPEPSSFQLLEEPTDDSQRQGHSNSGSTSSTSGYSSAGGDSLDQLSPLEPLSSPGLSNSSPSQGSSSSSSYDDNASTPTLCPIIDTDIRLHIRGPLTLQHGCPNVSLSPIFEHRLSSMSSISSGRNSSFDEGDAPPLLLADVLAVSHGGLIKEMIIYFVEELGCKILGTRTGYLISPFNTAISKFTITVGEDSTPPRITCITINDKDHLIEPDVYGLEETGEF